MDKIDIFIALFLAEEAVGTLSMIIIYFLFKRKQLKALKEREYVE